VYINSHTYYSLRYGTFSPKKLLELAHSNGLTTLALTDINTTSACLDFIRLAPRYNIKPVVGVDFREGITQRFIALAKNNDGFEEINIYLTALLHGDCTHADSLPDFENVWIIYPFQKEQTRVLKPHEFIGVSPRDLDYIRLKKIDVQKFVVLPNHHIQNQARF
jgi:DNA polymerase III alpha subunit